MLQGFEFRQIFMWDLVESGSSDATYALSFMRSVLEYACFIYFLSSIFLQEKIEGIQFSIIWAALGYRRSTLKNVLLAEAGLSPLSVRAEFLSKGYLFRIFSNSTSSTLKSLNSPLLYLKEENVDRFSILASRAFELLILLIYLLPRDSIFLGMTILLCQHPFQLILIGVRLQTSWRSWFCCQ